MPNYTLALTTNDAVLSMAPDGGACHDSTGGNGQENDASYTNHSTVFNYDTGKNCNVFPVFCPF